MSTGKETAQARTAAAQAARRANTRAALGRVHEAISRFRREKTPATVAALARRAGVSRTFLYQNAEARAAVRTATTNPDRPLRTTVHPDDPREATWRERALNAEDALKTATAEILSQRSRIGELLGRIRDLQAEFTDQSIARITTQNTTMQQRVRQLTLDNRTLEERLTAARSNLRFQDRRVADLEAKHADPTHIGRRKITPTGDRDE